MIVVDECQCVTEWGHTFCKDYLHIGDFVDSLPSRPVVVAVSAYLEKEQCYEITDLLHMEKGKLYFDKSARPNLKEEIKDMDKGEIAVSKKISMMKSNVKATYGDGSIIIFCSDGNEVEKVYKMLHKDYGDKITYTYNKLNAMRSTANELDFIRSKCKIIVATPGFGFGMDKADIRLVILYGAMMSFSEYLRCSHYAGLDNKPTTSLLLFYEEDYFKIYNELKIKRSSHKNKVKMAEIDQMVRWTIKKSRRYVEGYSDFF